MCRHLRHCPTVRKEHLVHHSTPKGRHDKHSFHSNGETIDSLSRFNLDDVPVGNIELPDTQQSDSRPQGQH